jgi:hypothetical protein
MMLKLQIPPDVEAALIDQAARLGVTPETLAIDALKERFGAKSARKRQRRHAAWVARLTALIDLHPRVNHLVDDSRDSIYDGCGE